MKFFKALIALLAITLGANAATIKWYSDMTDTTTMLSNDVVAVERASPQGYRSIRWGTLQGLLGTSTQAIQNIYITTQYVDYTFVTNFNGKQTFIQNSYITNLYAISNAYFYQTNFVNYEYVTNLFVTSNAYFYETNFANYNYTTNLFVESNAYFYETNFVNYSYTTNLTVESNAYFFETNFVNNTYTTNLYVETNAYFYQTNFVAYEYVTNLTVVNQLISTNNYFTYVYNLATTVTNGIYFHTNSWAGPTNVLPMHLTSQDYLTWTPMEITGMTSLSNYVVENVLLTITNASDSNVTLYIPADVLTGDGARSYIVTNATVGMLSVQYNPNGGRTNAVFRLFY